MIREWEERKTWYVVWGKIYQKSLYYSLQCSPLPLSKPSCLLSHTGKPLQSLLWVQGMKHILCSHSSSRAEVHLSSHMPNSLCGAGRLRAAAWGCGQCILWGWGMSWLSLNETPSLGHLSISGYPSKLCAALQDRNLFCSICVMWMNREEAKRYCMQGCAAGLVKWMIGVLGKRCGAETLLRYLEKGCTSRDWQWVPLLSAVSAFFSGYHNCDCPPLTKAARSGPLGTSPAISPHRAFSQSESFWLSAFIAFAMSAAEILRTSDFRGHSLGMMRMCKKKKHTYPRIPFSPPHSLGLLGHQPICHSAFWVISPDKFWKYNLEPLPCSDVPNAEGQDCFLLSQ